MSRPNEWEAALEWFLRAKLRTHSGSTSAAVMFHSIRYVIDGVCLAIEDHAELWESAFTVIRGHLRGCRDMLSRYFAWCLVDALLKYEGTPTLLFRRLAEELPRLVGYEMPLAALCDRESNLAERESKQHFIILYFDMLRSWWCTRTRLPPDALTGCEQYLQYQLRIRAPPQRALSGPKAEGAPKLQDPQQVERVMTSLMHGGASAAGSPAAISGPRPVGAKAVEQLISQLYDESRLKLCCPHCGAFFSSVSARDRHNRMHFEYRRGPQVRKHYADSNGFVQHTAAHDDGWYVQSTVPLGDANRRSVALEVRSAKAHESSADSIEKFGVATRGKDVIVADPSRTFVCKLCQQRINPVYDDIVQEWVLRGTQTLALPSNVMALAHVSCLNANS